MLDSVKFFPVLFYVDFSCFLLFVFNIIFLYLLKGFGAGAVVKLRSVVCVGRETVLLWRGEDWVSDMMERKGAGGYEG